MLAMIMDSLSRPWALPGLALALLTSNPASGADDLLAPAGDWKVVTVHVDGDMGVSDAALASNLVYRGRIIHSDARMLSIDDGDVCARPAATSEATRLSSLVATTVGARPDGAPGARLDDYDLAIPDMIVKVRWIRCFSGHFGPSGVLGHPNTWIIQTGPAQAFVGWEDRTILELTPVDFHRSSHGVENPFAVSDAVEP
jgi:hypothetical protein